MLDFANSSVRNHAHKCDFKAKCKATVSVVTVVQYCQNFIQITHKHVEYQCVQEK